MNVIYTGGTGQQRAWVASAIAQMRFPWEALTALEVNVSWPVEPSLPGHKEYACTIQGVDGNHFSVEIRRAFDDPTYIKDHPPFDEMGDTHPVSAERFYIETVAHELGHVLAFHFMATMTSGQLDTMCACFEKRVSGAGLVVGTQADLHPVGAKWEDMLQEGIAEALKDIYLPDALREFDNRTNWKLSKDRYEDFISFFTGSGGFMPGTERVRAFWDGSTVSGALLDPHQPGLAVINDHLNHLDPAAGYPRIRWIGADAGGPNSGVRDYTDFWTDIVYAPGNVHQNIVGFGNHFDDTGTWANTGAFITDPDAPPNLDGSEHTTAFIGLMIAIDTAGEWAGVLQLSQFLPDPEISTPPWPYKDPAITASGSLRAAIQLQTH
jgi:hypothetical protein